MTARAFGAPRGEEGARKRAVLSEQATVEKP